MSSATQALGKATLQRAIRSILWAMSLLAKHHIFMHALAGLRYRNTGCSDARCSAASPYAFVGVSSK